MEAPEYTDGSRERNGGAGPGPAADRGEGALRIDIVTLFPAMFAGPFDVSMVARARRAGLVDLRVHDLRAWATDRHRTADDYAFGGGGGMVLKPEPLFRAVESLLDIAPLTPGGPPPPAPVVLMTPQGRRFDHAAARALAAAARIVVLCGHYEGFDERVRTHLATDEISIGDFVVTGGELPAMLLADAVIRLRPGVVGLTGGVETDSHAAGRLEHPHYTRPADFRGWTVPDVLLSGDHGAVDTWRRRTALERTAARRPDLLAAAPPSAEERGWLEAGEGG
ncbi:MAG: tRNA (guanosine(37)-N1)-methyltransferase TrmD [Anaerolineae bacterium]